MRRKTGITEVDNAKRVIGSDEVGWGCMAGPLLVVAASAPVGWDDPTVTDSKQLDDNKRKVIYDRYYHDDRFSFAPVLVAAEAFDNMGPANALLWAHREAVRQCRDQVRVEAVVAIDGNLAVSHIAGLNAVCVPKGDALVPEIGLASCVAKVMRDTFMRKAAEAYPGYGFEEHFGYVTPEHKAALAKLGPCPLHRRSFGPVQKVIAERNKGEQPQEAWALFDDDDA